MISIQSTGILFCIYAPSICIWNFSQYDIYFLNSSHFIKFLYVAFLSTWLSLEPSYLAQWCIYTGATLREEIMLLSIVFLKLWFFFKISHFQLFGIFAKDTNFINGTPHTHKYTYTQHRHMHIHMYSTRAFWKKRPMNRKFDHCVSQKDVMS